MKQLIFLVLVLLLHAGVTTTSGVTLLGTAKPTYNQYLPLVADECREQKAGYAIGWHRPYIDYDKICGGGYHYWDSNPRSFVTSATFAPTLKCWDAEQYASFEANYDPATYNGPLIIISEWMSDHHPGECADEYPASTWEVAAWYVYLEESYCPNCKFVGPVTESNVPVYWLRQFYDYVYQISGKHPDLHAWSIHDYEKMPGNPQTPCSYYVEIHEDYMAELGIDIPIWVTEFGVDTVEEMEECIETYESNERIERYDYFAPAVPGGEYWPFPETALFDEDGLTPIGCAFFQMECNILQPYP